MARRNSMRRSAGWRAGIRPHHNPSPLHTQQISAHLTTWGGYCRLNTTTFEASRKTDLHGVCRFCLRADSHPEAVQKLMRAGVLDFAFLSLSQSVVEQNVIKLVNIVGPPVYEDGVYIASIQDCYLDPWLYKKYRQPVPAPEPPEPVPAPVPTPATVPPEPAPDNTARARGFLDTLKAGRGLLNKIWRE